MANARAGADKESKVVRGKETKVVGDTVRERRVPAEDDGSDASRGKEFASDDTSRSFEEVCETPVVKGSPKLSHFPDDDALQSLEGESETPVARELLLSSPQACLVLMSFAFGSAVIILPNTLLRLGPVTWTLFIAIILTIVGYCTYLNIQSTRYLLSLSKTAEILRDPYPALAEFAGGRIFRKITIITMHIAMVTNSLGFVLLSATLLKDAFPLEMFDKYNSIRLWVCVICVLMTPLIYYGKFADLFGAATFAVTASGVSLAAIFINCMIFRFKYDVQSGYVYVRPETSIFTTDLFVLFGLISFAAAGPSFSAPNVVVHVSESEKVPSSVGTMFVILFILYVIAGSIPYVIFGEATGLTVTATFKSLYNVIGGSIMVPALTIVCDISMSLHLLLEAILIVNPVYQHIEGALDIPRELGWKRVAIRTSGILFIFFAAIAFPTFRSVLSIIGGVPLTLVGIIFPIYIHSKIFDNSWITKAVHLLILIFFTIFMIGNFGVTIEMLVYSTLASIKQASWF